ncbi:hypothetical protein MXD81_24480, partial [Microbacteriaceae bacterium K1510]|nr:hypothetical protein [Microbacteriaceae bacterium K1510]
LQSSFAHFFHIQFVDKTWPDVDEEKLRAEGGVWGRWLSALEAAEVDASDETGREIARLAKKEALRRIGGSLG